MVLIVAGSWVAPYLRTQSAPPRLTTEEEALGKAAQTTEQRIITNKVLVRLTEAQVRAIRSELAEPATPVPIDEASPTTLPTETPVETLLEPTATLSPSPALSENPTPDPTPTPTESPVATPIATPFDDPTPEPTPTPSPEGEILGVQSDTFSSLPDFSVIEKDMEKMEFVSEAPTEGAQPQRDFTLTDWLKTKVTGETPDEFPAIERWIVIDLIGEEKVVRVNNAVDLRPIGEPILPSLEESAVPAPDEAEPKRTDVAASDEAELATTRNALHALREVGLFEYVEPVLAVTASVAANDPYFTSSGAIGQPYDDQWGLKRIQAPAAWGATTGSEAVVVAVVDSGLDFTHRDIQGNVWENPGETGFDTAGRDKKTNHVDDDRNGYVDDWRGWDFANGDNDPTDDVGHGTHVSGIIGAKGNNTTDIAGTMWNVKILPVKFLSVDGGTSADAVAALRYAADRGAKVINNSWGGSGTSIAIHDAVEYAYDKGSLLVAASGNDYCNLDRSYCWHTPAIEDKVMAVTASTPHDTRATFANYGTKIELAAPGGDVGEFQYKGILSLRAAGTDLGYPLEGQPLTFGSGTSMAAPYVSGVAGLLFALHPNWTNTQVRQQLQVSADDLGRVGRDKEFGYGLVNATRAVGQPILVLNLTAPTTNTKIQRSPNQKIDIVGTVRGAAFKRYILEVDEGLRPWQWTKIHDTTTLASNVLLKQWTPDPLPVDTFYTLRLTANPGTPEQMQVIRQLELSRPAAVFINNNDEVTTTRAVTLTFWGSGSPSTIKQLRIRNSGEPWGAWQPLATTKPWTLATGDGLKTVEVEFQYNNSSAQIVQYTDQIVLDTTGTANRPPVVNAGPGDDIIVTQGAILDGTVTDDGRPTPPGAVTTTWTKLEGPGTVQFVNHLATDTTATFSTTGLYRLQLEARDGEHTVRASTTVKVNDRPDPLSYLTGILSHPNYNERRPVIPQTVPLEFLFQYLPTDSLKCLSLKLDDRLVTPEADADAYRQTTTPLLPPC